MIEPIRNQLFVFLDAMGPDCCIRAMDEAVAQGHANWAYTKGILEKKREQGVRSIADWDRVEKSWNGKKSSVQSENFQPDAERIRRSNEQLDKFFEEMEGKKKEDRQA